MIVARALAFQNVPGMRTLQIVAVVTWVVCASGTSKRGLSEADSWSSFFCSDLSTALGAPQPVSWAYSWAINPAAPCPQLASGLATFVPMVWGRKDVNATLNFTAGVRFLLGFNEPNGAKQSDLTPAEAASLWPYVAATAKAAGLGLVSPAPAGNGVAWLDSFFSQCNNCLDEVVAIAQHTYACTGPALEQVCGCDSPACICASLVRMCVSMLYRRWDSIQNSASRFGLQSSTAAMAPAMPVQPSTSPT